MKKLWILLLLFISGCAYIPPHIRPEKAKIPELRFWYWKDSSWNSAYGQGADHFKVGDVKRFKIKVHEDAGRCEFRFIDGNHDQTWDCRGKSELVINIGEYGEDSAEKLGFSITSERLGSQIGWFYPSTRKLRKNLLINFECPQQSTKESYSTCIRPSEFDFIYSFAAPSEGKLLHRVDCNSGYIEDKIYDYKALKEMGFQFILSNQKPDYCTVSLSYKTNENSYTHEINVRFYDNRYIPLPKPKIYYQNDGFYFCGSNEHYKITVNDEDMHFYGRCIHFSEPFDEAMAWDRLGRFSFQKEVIHGKPKSY